jgi:hypothetical protein
MSFPDKCKQQQRHSTADAVIALRNASNEIQITSQTSFISAFCNPVFMFCASYFGGEANPYYTIINSRLFRGKFVVKLPSEALKDSNFFHAETSNGL